jgi:hypothetical protein
MINQINNITAQANLTVASHHEMLSEAINTEFCDQMFEYDTLMKKTDLDETLTIEERNARMHAFKSCLDSILKVDDCLQMHSNSHQNGL